MEGKGGIWRDFFFNLLTDSSYPQKVVMKKKKGSLNSFASYVALNNSYEPF